MLYPSNAVLPSNLLLPATDLAPSVDRPTALELAPRTGTLRLASHSLTLMLLGTGRHMTVKPLSAETTVKRDARLLTLSQDLKAVILDG